MNNKKLQELINESAELLDNINEDNKPLNEGAGTIIFTSIVAFPFLMTGFALIFLKIESLIKKHRDKKEIKKILKNDKMILINESKSLLDIYYKIISKVKFAKYNPVVISMMNDYIDFCKKADIELEKIDNEFLLLKNKEEFYKKEKYFKNKYNLYNKKYEAELNKLEIKYKNPKNEWIVNMDIIPKLDKYIDYFSDFDMFYYKNTDGDDFWEGMDIFDIDPNDKDYDSPKLFKDVYNIWNIVPESYSHKIPYKNAFKYIKFQFSGNEPSDSGEEE